MDGPTLRDDVEAYLARTGVSVTRFGRTCVGDQRLVRDLRGSSKVGPIREARIRATMAAHPDGMPPIQCEPTMRPRMRLDKRVRPTRLVDENGEHRGPVPEQLRVNRDPCGWCGVRADIGCSHPRAAPTWMGR
jgi:hypothetical protein